MDTVSSSTKYYILSVKSRGTDSFAGSSDSLPERSNGRRSRGKLLYIQKQKRAYVSARLLAVGLRLESRAPLCAHRALRSPCLRRSTSRPRWAGALIRNHPQNSASFEYWIDGFNYSLRLVWTLILANVYYIRVSNFSVDFIQIFIVITKFFTLIIFFIF